MQARSEPLEGAMAVSHSEARPESDLARDRWFADLVAGQRDRAVGLAWRLVGGDHAAAEDVAQEAFVRAWRGWDRFRGEAKSSTWFYRILVNEAHRYRRWRFVRWRREARAEDEGPEQQPDPQGAPSGDPALRLRIGRALEKLTQAQRDVFVLVHLEGFTVRETAELTGKAAGTIKSHLHRALVALRTELADLEPSLEAAS